MNLKECKYGDIIVYKYYDSSFHIYRYLTPAAVPHSETYSQCRYLCAFEAKQDIEGNYTITNGLTSISYDKISNLSNEIQGTGPYSYLNLDKFSLDKTKFDYFSNINFINSKLVTKPIVLDQICWEINKNLFKGGTDFIDPKIFTKIKTKSRKILKEWMILNLDIEVTIPELNKYTIKFIEKIIKKPTEPTGPELPKSKSRFQLIKY